jgi:hypothetical protein
MIDAVTSEATRDSSFANEVKADATRVVTLKMERGLARSEPPLLAVTSPRSWQ